MSGPASAAVLAAAIELARLAPAEDRVELRFFTDGLEAPFVLSATGAEERALAARRLLEARAPSGPTRILAALEALAAERVGARDDALVFLLSDGREETGATAADAGRVRDALAATRARLCVFALGPDPDLEFLGRLLAPGEAPLAVSAAAELVTLFLRESARDDLLVDGPIALLARPPAVFGADSTAADIARAAEGGRLPAVARLARTVAAPAAQVLWQSAAGGEPALAFHAVGAGNAAAFAGLAARGAVVGREWDEALAPLARSLARAHRDLARAGTRALWAHGRIELENVPADWPPMVESRLAPVGEESQGRALALAVPAVGAGIDPRSLRESEPAPGLELAFAARLCEVRLGLPESGVASAVLWIGFPPASEFGRAVALGLAPAEPGGAYGGGGGRSGGRPLAPWLLLAGLGCTGVGMWTASQPRKLARLAGKPAGLDRPK